MNPSSGAQSPGLYLQVILGSVYTVAEHAKKTYCIVSDQTTNIYNTVMVCYILRLNLYYILRSALCATQYVIKTQTVINLYVLLYVGGLV